MYTSQAAARETQLVTSFDDALWEWGSTRARQGVDDGHPFEPHLAPGTHSQKSLCSDFVQPIYYGADFEDFYMLGSGSPAKHLNPLLMELWASITRVLRYGRP